MIFTDILGGAFGFISLMLIGMSFAPLFVFTEVAIMIRGDEQSGHLRVFAAGTLLAFSWVWFGVYNGPFDERFYNLFDPVSSYLDRTFSPPPSIAEAKVTPIPSSSGTGFDGVRVEVSMLILKDGEYQFEGPYFYDSHMRFSKRVGSYDWQIYKLKKGDQKLLTQDYLITSCGDEEPDIFERDPNRRKQLVQITVAYDAFAIFRERNNKILQKKVVPSPQFVFQDFVLSEQVKQKCEEDFRWKEAHSKKGV